LEADMPGVGLFPEIGGCSHHTIPRTAKIVPTLRPLKVEMIFEVWDDFQAPNGPYRNIMIDSDGVWTGCSVTQQGGAASSGTI